MKEMISPQIINIMLLTAGALQGILVSIFLAKRKFKDNPQRMLLLLLVIVLSVQLLMKVANKLWLWQHLSSWYIISYELPFLYGPLLYLYTRLSVTERTKMTSRDHLHFLPFLYILITFTLFNFLPKPPFHTFLFEANNTFFVVHALLQLISVLIYSFLSWNLIGNGQQDKSVNLWLRQFIAVTCFVFLFIILILQYLYYYYPTHQGVRFLFLFLAVYIYWISYQVFTRLNIPASPREHTNKGELPNFASETDNPAFQDMTPKQKYVNTRLSPAESERIKNQLLVLVEKEKPFLDPLLSIESLADQLRVQRHHLSQVLNERLNKNFFDFVNYYRIETAKDHLLDITKNHFTIAAIAYDSGFNSVSSFNIVFKKHTSLTPSQFKKEWPIRKTI